MELCRSVVFGVIGIFLVLCFSPGCTYWHSEHKANISKELKRQFHDDHRKSSETIFQTMLSNLREVEGRMAVRQEQLYQLRTRLFLNQLDNRTWSAISTEIDRILTGQEALAGTLASSLREALKKRGVKDTEIETLRQAKTKAEQLVNSETQSALKWKAHQAFFQQTIRLVASEKELSKDAVMESIFGTPLTGEKKPDGQPLRVQDVLKEDFDRISSGENPTQLLKEYTSDVYDSSKAPGIRITILGLGLDLVSAKLGIANTERDYLNEQIKILLEASKNFETIKLVKQRLLDRLDPYLATPMLPSFDKNGTPRTTINTLLQKRRNTKNPAEQREIENAIKGALLILAGYSVSHMLDDPAILKLEIEAKQQILNHANSIQVSAGRAAEQEAIISRGLESLSMYYEGGWKPEDTASLIQLAQSIGLAWIAGGVN